MAVADDLFLVLRKDRHNEQRGARHRPLVVPSMANPMKAVSSKALLRLARATTWRAD